MKKILEKISFEKFMSFDFYRGGCIVELPERKLQDKEIEEIWEYLGDIPITDEECLDDDYFIWPKGSDKYEDVWRWFDVNHSKGVGFLVNEFESKKQFI